MEADIEDKEIYQLIEKREIENQVFKKLLAKLEASRKAKVEKQLKKKK